MAKVQSRLLWGDIALHTLTGGMSQTIDQVHGGSAHL